MGWNKRFSAYLKGPKSSSAPATILIEVILCDPFQGIGKPEPLRHLAPGMCSRRLTQEHRIVCLVRDDRIDFLQARYHY